FCCLLFAIGLSLRVCEKTRWIDSRCPGEFRQRRVAWCRSAIATAEHVEGPSVRNPTGETAEAVIRHCRGHRPGPLSAGRGLRPAPICEITDLDSGSRAATRSTPGPWRTRGAFVRGAATQHAGSSEYPAWIGHQGTILSDSRAAKPQQ